MLISCPNVKYLKETEWINKEISEKKVSRCYHFVKCNFAKVANSNIKTWSKNYVVYYNRKVKIKLHLQNQLFYKKNCKNWIIASSYVPRKSIENYHNSYKMTDYCLTCQNRHVVGDNMCNSLFKLKWTNQPVIFFDFLKDLNVLQNGLDVIFT